MLTPYSFVSMSGLLKPEKDFTKDADKLIPEAEALAKVRITYATTTNIIHADLPDSDRCPRCHRQVVGAGEASPTGTLSRHRSISNSSQTNHDGAIR